jgi:NAD(P)-dependent dehydrogenase (short-subunit alcohol dehydrogenase family)
METLLAGKVALVTGGGSGIGAATAALFGKYGASVVVSDIDDTKGHEVVSQIIQNGGHASYIHADVSVACDCQWLVSSAVGLYGRLDIAFNNAGIGGEANKVADMTLEGWKKVIDVNLNSVFYCMKYQLAQMVVQGAGSIINNSSILGSVGFAGSAAYVASKHALLGLTQTAALEYGTAGVRVNCIGPAFINTPLLTAAGMDEDVKQSMLVPLHPIGRLGEAGEVAELVAWLASDKSSFVTGSYYPVDGGYLAR